MKVTTIIFILVTFSVLGIVSCAQNQPAVVSAAVTQATPKPSVKTAAPVQPKELQTAVFAGGCFWGVEAVFEHTRGVVKAKSGYAGGTAETANYDEVSAGETDHAESVEVKFDPAQVSYRQLLQIFFSVAHDPTELDRQGPDIGRQYRSEIFFVNDEQKAETQKYIDELRAAKIFPKPIVTKLSSLEKFYEAEKYHQDYMKRNPKDAYIVYHDKPKIENLKKKFPKLYVVK